MKKILVVGSLNMDFSIETPRIPVPGETIMGTGVKLVPGGKGANQVYTIGKLGGDVAMIGAVGDDSFGDMLIDNLENVGVNVEGIERISGGTTGQAFIPVDESGENSIIVIGGTNGQVDEAILKKYEYLMDEADIVVMQQEIPLTTVMAAKQMAMEKGKTIIVDPAPAAAMPDEFWDGIDYIKPNETELGILIGKELSTQEEYKEAAQEMLRKGVKKLLVTLGSKGCLIVSSEGEEFIPANKVKAVDTTAAGDTFTGAFAVALSQGKSEKEAITFAQKASAIAVTRKGAQASVPTLEEVLASM
ncbi:MAG: ribokinase [Eubacteriales bacterium]|nr:ribokinase [Eubacteriales bacterium]